LTLLTVCFHISFFTEIFDDLTGSLFTGEPFGSAQIDEAFEKEVECRLKSIDTETRNHSGLSNYAANDMAKNSFQPFKIMFGESIFTKVKDIGIRVPTLRRDFNHAEAKISDGRMRFTE
jgi:hypothetical protein